MQMAGGTSALVAAPADEVFRVLTDVERLPEWNRRIQRVEERPDDLVKGAEWTVIVRVAGQSFPSRSVVLALDRGARRFSYRSKRVDRNPTFTEWTWTVAPDGDGAVVTVEWELHPSGFLRRHLLAPMRARHFARGETADSLDALARLCRAPEPRP
jgi:uncharacterized protein YndB with AHSA1/START domain